MGKFWSKLFRSKAGRLRLLLLILIILFIVAFALGYLTPLKSILDAESFSFYIGEFRLSAYFLGKILLTIGVLFWVVSSLSALIEHQVAGMPGIKPSKKLLLTKILQIVMYIIFGLLALQILGINLTTLTVFSGAVGVGIGFGLQKITSNFISGLILLFEQSIESGDLIELTDGTYGFVRSISARYALIETLDGKEVMLPNEDFITSRVINWTFSNSNGRVDVNIGVAYDSDIELARQLILDAAQQHPRCLSDPPAVCYLREFGDSSVNFILYFWVADVTQGRLEAQSDVMRTIWRKFKEQKINIPFPQRDIHIKNPGALS